MRRDDEIFRSGPKLIDVELTAGDRLNLEMPKEALQSFRDSGDFDDIELLSEESLRDIYPESERLLQLDLPEDSRLIGLSIAESGIADFGFRVVGIARRGGNKLFPGGGDRLEVGDRLLVHGSKNSIRRIRGLQTLEPISGEDEFNPLESPGFGYAEVTLAPGSALAGETPRGLDFRNRYGLSILAIWREGRSIGSHVRNVRLEFGDALLLSGKRERIEALTSDDDFLLLSRGAYDSETATTGKGKTWLAAGIMAAVVAAVLAGWLPIAVAAIAGATLMIASRCLDIEEAYKSIEWKSVFLIACMIPLGIAMQKSGAAEWVGNGVAKAVGPFGPWGLIVGLYLITALATTIVPTTALVVIMAHIGMDACKDFEGIDERTVVMAIALAASASFTSPISHPANVLVMGPGGYRFLDYVKMGMLLALAVMLTVLPILALWH